MNNGNVQLDERVGDWSLVELCIHRSSQTATMIYNEKTCLLHRGAVLTSEYYYSYSSGGQRIL